jgi:hypothetical protein
LAAIPSGSCPSASNAPSRQARSSWKVAETGRQPSSPRRERYCPSQPSSTANHRDGLSLQTRAESCVMTVLPSSCKLAEVGAQRDATARAAPGARGVGGDAWPKCLGCHYRLSSAAIHSDSYNIIK